jgi:hypothetical protein
MDIVGFLNDVTGGQLLLWKVIATTTVFALAGLQVLLAARFYNATTVPPISGKSAAAAHRFSGRIAIVLAVIVAISCIAGPAGPTTPTRVLLHSVFGTLAFVVLIAKFMILRVMKKGDKALPFVGVSLFLVFGAIWATTVADYVSAR